MPGMYPMPEPAELAIELERPCGEQADEQADRDRVDGGNAVAVEAEHERRDHQPQPAAEIEPFGAQVIAAEAEVRGERQRQAANRGVGGRDIVRRVVREPGRNREPETEREARPGLPSPHLGCTCRHRLLHAAPPGAYPWTLGADGAFGHFV